MEHVTHMKGIIDAYKSLVREPEGKRLLGSHGRRWKEISERILEKQDGKLWTGFNWLRI